MNIIGFIFIVIVVLAILSPFVIFNTEWFSTKWKRFVIKRKK